MWYQEWHETAARTARVRARQLRQAGFTVFVSAPEMQITPVGCVRLTLLTVYDWAGRRLPEPPEGGQPVRF